MLLSWGGDRVKQQTVRHISGTSAQRGHPLNPGTCMLPLAQRPLRDPSWNKTSVRFRKATTREERKILLLRKQLHDGGRGRRREWSPECPSWGTSPLTLPHSTTSRRCSHSSVQFSGAPWTPPAGGRGLPSASWCGRRSRNPAQPGPPPTFWAIARIPAGTRAVAEIQSSESVHIHPRTGEPGRRRDHLGNSGQICSPSPTDQRPGDRLSPRGKVKGSTWQMVTQAVCRYRPTLPLSGSRPLPSWGPRALVPRGTTHPFSSPAFAPFFLMRCTFPRPRLLRARAHLGNNGRY